MREQSQSSEGVSHSLTDLMTSIAVIFILLFLVFVKTEEDAIAFRKRETKSNVEALFAALEGEFSGSVEIHLDPNDPLTLAIVLRDDPKLLSFEHNKSEINDTSKRFLSGFVPRLTKVVCAEKAQKTIDSIIIQGHTDSTGDDDVNTRVSAERATAVLIESRSILKDLEKNDEHQTGREGCFLRFAQATGRGRQELIRDAGGNEDRAKSRRVVVKVRVKSLEQREKLLATAKEATN